MLFLYIQCTMSVFLSTTVFVMCFRMWATGFFYAFSINVLYSGDLESGFRVFDQTYAKARILK